MTGFPISYLKDEEFGYFTYFRLPEGNKRFFPPVDLNERTFFSELRKTGFVLGMAVLNFGGSHDIAPVAARKICTVMGVNG